MAWNTQLTILNPEPCVYTTSQMKAYPIEIAPEKLHLCTFKLEGTSLNKVPQGTFVGTELRHMAPSDTIKL